MRALLLSTLLAVATGCGGDSRGLSWPKIKLTRTREDVVTVQLATATAASVKCLRVLQRGGKSLGFADTNDEADRPMLDVPVQGNLAQFRLGCAIDEAFLSFKAFGVDCANLTTDTVVLLEDSPQIAAAEDAKSPRFPP